MSFTNYRSMRRILLVVLLFFSLNVNAQELFEYPDGMLASSWVELIKKDDNNGKSRFYKQRFVRIDTSYYLQLSVYRRSGSEGLLMPGNKIHIELLMRKGNIDLTCASGAIEEQWFYFALYPLTTQQLDAIIQNKFVKMQIETPIDTLNIEGVNSLNYDWRSGAAAIITERDINGRPIDIIKRRK